MKENLTAKKILLLAAPILLESIAQNILNITDTAFMGRVGEVSLGAVAIGSLYYFVFIMIALGLGLGSQIIIARRYGEKNFKMIGRTLEQTQYMMLTFAFIVFAFSSIFLLPTLNFIVESSLIREQAWLYLSIRIFGFIPAFLNVSFRVFFVGIARTKVIAYTTIVMTIVNIVLNYLLIFGKFGFPEMGIQGAALASVIAECCAFIVFVIYARFISNPREFRLFRFNAPNLHLIKRILKIASPLMLQYFVSFSCWFAFFLLIEKMGQTQLAVSNLIRSVYILMCLPIWSFSAVTNTFVSQAIGRGDTHKVMGIMYKVISISLIFTLSTTAILAIFAKQVLMVLTNDIFLIQQAIPVFYVIIGSAPLLAIAVIVFSTLTATGKTTVALTIEIIVLAVYILYAWLVINKLQWGLPLAWTVEYLYAISMGLISFLYMKSGKWIKNKV